MTTFISLPVPDPGESLQERLEKLLLWSHSLDGHLYTIGSALTELRKEIAHIQSGLRAQGAKQ